MRQRPSSRLLVLNPLDQVLLFRFRTGLGSQEAFWATPGGALEQNETYEEAACRELLEETGVRISHPGPPVGQRTALFSMPDGEKVEAAERYFLVRVADADISDEHWTELEREIMTAHRWWSADDLAGAEEQVWPEDLSKLLIDAGAWSSL